MCTFCTCAPFLPCTFVSFVYVYLLYLRTVCTFCALYQELPLNRLHLLPCAIHCVQVRGDFWAAARFQDAVKIPYIAPSLGGVESLVGEVQCRGRLLCVRCSLFLPCAAVSFCGALLSRALQCRVLSCSAMPCTDVSCAVVQWCAVC